MYLWLLGKQAWLLACLLRSGVKCRRRRPRLPVRCCFKVPPRAACAATTPACQRATSHIFACLCYLIPVAFASLVGHSGTARFYACTNVGLCCAEARPIASWPTNECCPSRQEHMIGCSISGWVFHLVERSIRHPSQTSPQSRRERWRPASPPGWWRLSGHHARLQLPPQSTASRARY